MTNDFWAEIAKRDTPMSPELQFLKGVEDRQGGPVKMRELIQTLVIQHFTVARAFFAYLRTCFLVVKHNPDLLDKMVNVTSEMIDDCLRGENLKVISEITNQLEVSTDPTDKEKYKKTLVDFIQKIHPDSWNEEIYITLPTDLAQQVVKHTGGEILSTWPSTKSGQKETVH